MLADLGQMKKACINCSSCLLILTSSPPTSDELLRQGVAEHGDTDHWKTIALSVPGRSNKACRKVIIKYLYNI